MLVLSRKMDEQICIGSNIRVTVVQIKGGSVRIGIEAPDDVRVLRSELLGKAANGAVAVERDRPIPSANVTTARVQAARVEPAPGGGTKGEPGEGGGLTVARKALAELLGFAQFQTV